MQKKTGDGKNKKKKSKASLNRDDNDVNEGGDDDA